MPDISSRATGHQLFLLLLRRERLSVLPAWVCFNFLLVNLYFIWGSFPFLTCAVCVDRYNISSGRWSEVTEAGTAADQPWPLYAHSAVMFEVGAPQVILVLMRAGLNLVLPVNIQT